MLRDEFSHSVFWLKDPHHLHFFPAAIRSVHPRLVIIETAERYADVFVNEIVSPKDFQDQVGMKKMPP